MNSVARTSPDQPAEDAPGSTTLGVPAHAQVPRHVAIILDGNGRWATHRRLPRAEGHRRGVDAVRRTVEACARAGVEYLTVFAFSSENWRRPQEEVSLLMRLFILALQREVDRMARNGLRLRVVGDVSRFESALREQIARAEASTARNTGMVLTIAANYGGRWDMLQATTRLIEDRVRSGKDLNAPVTERELAPHLAIAYAPEPDLFIRTGGERRISNFMLWQLAYTELYFCDCYWPDFDEAELATAFDWFRQRERRYGRTSTQIAETEPLQPDAVSSTMGPDSAPAGRT